MSQVPNELHAAVAEAPDEDCLLFLAFEQARLPCQAAFRSCENDSADLPSLGKLQRDFGGADRVLCPGSRWAARTPNQHRVRPVSMVAFDAISRVLHH